MSAGSEILSLQSNIQKKWEASSGQFWKLTHQRTLSKHQQMHHLYEPDSAYMNQIMKLKVNLEQ